MGNKVKIAVVGIGAISGIYLKNISNIFSEIELTGAYDFIRERSEKAQKEYGFPKIYDSLEDILSDSEVEIVLNLTRPHQHYDVTKMALEAGKHVYTEKPLAATWEEGKALVELARRKKLLLCGAPDTFLGAGIQTCRKLIDEGFIGVPVGTAAFMINRGPELWHPEPDFFYKHGAGPMMDMGPYYITAMINLLGGVTGIVSASKTSFLKRPIISQPHCGKLIDVEVPTYVTGILDFENGTMGTIFTTFDVYYDIQARFEIYGSEGTLIVPDPNSFGGSIKMLRTECGTYTEIPLMFNYEENSRGLGLADMARALQTGQDARADSGQLLHVLEILLALESGGKERKYLPIETKYTRKAPMENAPRHLAFSR